MKQNVLFLVHVEEMFRQFFPDKLYIHRIIKALSAKKYDRVFFLQSEVDEEGLANPLEMQVPDYDRICWGWGYEKGMFNEDEHKWVIPALGHEYTWVPTELRNMASELNDCNIFVGGGYSSECLQDFLDCLDFLDLDYKKIHGYIY